MGGIILLTASSQAAARAHVFFVLINKILWVFFFFFHISWHWWCTFVSLPCSILDRPPSTRADPHFSAAPLLGPGSLIILTPKITPALTFCRTHSSGPLTEYIWTSLHFWISDSVSCVQAAVPLDSLPLPLERRGGGDVQAADRQMKNETQAVVSQRANDACGDYRLQSAS